MRALLFHCRNYRVKINKLANRPNNIIPENVNENEQNLRDCIVVLITIEKNDEFENVSKKLSKEITRMTKDIGRNDVVILPFAHLSNNLANSKDCVETLNLIEEKIKNDCNIMRAHFGSHKSLLLDIYGHPGNARYREF